MGRMKNLQQQIETYTEAPFKIQKEYCKGIFKVMNEKDIKFLLKNARGNLKVAMTLALGDLNE